MHLGRVETLLWIGFGASALLVGFREWPPGHSISALDQLLNTSAYCFALWLWMRVLSDHAVGSTMRLAWTMMAWCSVFSILRHAFEFTSVLAGWHATMLYTLVSLRQFPIVLSLVCLTAGLVAMWASFAALGMGIRFEWADLFAAALIVLFVPFIISSRENMQDARSAWPLIRHLQSASPVLLAVPAVLAVVLHRIRQEMGGGQMAVAFRLLIAFLLLRLVALSASVTGIRTDFPILSAIGQAGGAAAIWLFPMAALKRWQMTVAASELARRYESNPGAELEQLAARSTESLS
ncbi:MAG TPA: hypothetical protein VG345_07055 [Bryobacteraceae bacterium]|nr:hypothetical protein [Bryobacteraceae bacterium]